MLRLGLCEAHSTGSRDFELRECGGVKRFRSNRASDLTVLYPGARLLTCRWSSSQAGSGQ